MKSYISIILLLLVSVIFRAQTSLPLISNSIQATDTIGCAPLVTTFSSNQANVSSWTWNFGDSSSSTEANPIHIYKKPGVYTVMLDVTYTDGSSRHFEQTNFIKAVAKPTIDAQVSPLSSCINNQSLQITNNSLNATSFIWNFGDGNLVSGEAPSYIYEAPGTYTINLFASNDEGCSSDSTITTVTIFPVQKKTIQIVSDSTSCDSSFIFQLNASPNGLSSYQWLLSDSSFYQGASISHSFDQFGSFNASLITKDMNGCIDTTHETNILKTIRSNDDFSISTTTACINSTITLQSNALNASSIDWDFGNGKTDTGKTVTTTFDTAGQFNITMIVNRLNGCGTITTKNNIITIIDKPSTVFSISDTNACYNEYVNFNILSTNANKIKWLFGDGSSSNVRNFRYKYKNTGSFIVKMIHQTGACYDTLSQKINVSKPFAAFTNPTSFDCTPVTVDFTNNSQNHATSAWYFSNGDTSFAENPQHIFNKPGTYNVKLVVSDAYGCSDSLTKMDAVEIKNNIPSTLEVGYFEGCAPLSVSFYNYSFGNGYWDWNFGDGSISNLSNPIHTYTKGGNYTISLTTLDSSGCAMTIDSFALVKVKTLTIDSTDVTLNCSSNEILLDAVCNDCYSSSWNLGDGTVTDSLTYTHSYANKGEYNIHFEGVSSWGCVSSKIFSINLDSCFVKQASDEGGHGTSTLADNWSTTPVSGGTPKNQYCNPITITIDNPVPTASVWKWHLGDGSIDTNKIPTHTYDSTGLFSLMLEYGTPNDLDTLYYPNFINVTGHSCDISVQSTESCYEIDLHISSTNTQLSNYFWSFDGELLPQHVASIDTLLSNSTNLHSLTLTTLDSNNCSYSSSIGIIANGIASSFDFDSSICLGDTFFINHNFSDDYNLNWNYGGNSVTNQSYYVFNTKGIKNLSVEVSDSNNCIINYDLGTISVISPNSNFNFDLTKKLCVGDTVYATAVDSNNSSYSWTPTNITTIASDTNYIGVVNDAGSYSMTLETKLNQCTAIHTKTSIKDASRATVDFIISQNSYCLPITAQFTDMSIAPISWEWDFGDSNSSNLQHNTYTFNTKPLDSITLTIVDSNGCTASVSKANIELFKSDIALSSDSGCAPYPISFTETSQNPVSWFWDFGDGSTNLNQSPIHEYDTNGNFDVTLIVTSADGCSDTLTLDKEIKIDKVVAEFSSSISNGCAPQPAYFTNASYNASNYRWDFGNGYVSNKEEPIQIYTIGGNYTTTLVAESISGCADTVQSLITVTGPAAHFSIQDSSICESDSIFFLNQSVGATSYSWIFGDGYSSSQTEPFHQYDSSNSYNVTLAVSDSFGCQHISSKDINITIHKLPNTDWALSDTIGCSPLTVSLESTTSANYYKWYMNGNIICMSDTHQRSLNTGNYDIKLVLETLNGCVDSSSKKVIVHPVYSVSLPSLSPVCETSDTLQVVSSINLGQWYIDGDSNVNNVFNLSSLAAGEHLIVQTIDSFCGDSDTTILTIDSLVAATIYAPETVCEYDSSFLLETTNSLGYWSGSGVIDPFTGLVDPSSANYGLNTVSYTIQNGSCTYHDTTSYHVIPTPNANFAIVDSIICENRHFELISPSNSSATTYTWQFVNNNDTLYSNDVQPFSKLSSGNWDIYLTTDVAGCMNNYSMQSVKVFDTAAPASPKIIRSTVINDIEVLTEWETPTFGMEKVTGFDIWRSSDTINFSLIKHVPIDQRSYVDSYTDVHDQNYYYTITPSSVCNIQTSSSNISSSILLTKESVDDHYIQFNWTAYSKWNEGVSHYILEKQNSNGNWEEVTSIPGDNLSITIEKP